MIIIDQITVVDSIMGTGKTSAMIQKMNLEKDKSYLFVTPFIDEIKRIIKRTDSDFKEPKYCSRDHTKLDDLHDLLANGDNIAMTHSLFLFTNARTEQLIVNGDYILILDESLDVLHSYNDDMKHCKSKLMGKDEPQFLLNHKLITIDENCNVNWIGEHDNKLDMHYSEIKKLADKGMLRCIKDKFYWEFTPDIFKWFSKIYVLTYLFSNTILDNYFQLHGFTYEKVSAEAFNDGFRLCPYSDSRNQRKQYAKLINLYDGKYNEIGLRRNAFSISWLKNKKQKGQLKEIQRAMRNYKNLVNASSDTVMWTTTKQYGVNEELEKVGGFKYTHILSDHERKLPKKEQKKLLQFVPCNARATNDYKDRTTLLYMLNYFVTPELKDYYSLQGYKLDVDQIALSSLLQWIWRSAIRDEKPINLYIPSSRMRKLLCCWLGVTPF